MERLYTTLRHQVPDNARRIVEICAEELPDYRAVAANAEEHTRMLDFAVFIRRRTFDLVANDHPLTSDDLAVITAIGEERGKNGMTHLVAKRILALHAAATMREIHEASGPQDLDDTMHLLGWLGHQAPIAQHAYTLGFLRGQKRHLATIARVGQFAEMALAGDPAATAYARDLGLTVPGRYQVIVVRAAGYDATARKPEDGLEVVWRKYRAPATWHRPDTLVALLPVSQDGAVLALVRDVASITGRPCAVGAATGPMSTLADTFTLARRVSRAVGAQTVPDHVWTVPDVFIEIGVAELPEIDRWLRSLVRQLAAGTDLIPTLHAYYRNDLDRSRTATALSIHPRTLDYRLQRAHELTGIDPRTTRGIRVFTTALTRARPW
jgi:hypothetical protein